MKAMTIRPRRYHRVDPISQLFDDFLTPYNRQRRVSNSSRVAMNVLEYDDAFELQLAAPGFSKENFSIEVENNHLVVSLTKPEKEDSKDFKRREFNIGAFTRKWELSDDIDQGNIEATYVNGILSVLLKKKEEAKKLAPRSIEIS